MRLAVISDIHGNISALEAVLKDIDRRGIQSIVNLGDSLSGPLAAYETAERLLELDLLTVKGNHDRMLVDRPVCEMGNWEGWIIDQLTTAHLEWLRSLPPTATLGDVFLCHATPAADDQNWLNTRGPDHRMRACDLREIGAMAEGNDASMILCGHTHVPNTVRLPNGQRIVNPGSVGCPAFLDTRGAVPFLHQTGAPDARFAVIEQKGADTWQVDLCSVPYDARAMIELAKEKGADNWVTALSTGWFE